MTGAQRHAHLLVVGRSLFAQRGPYGTSVEEIAPASGLDDRTHGRDEGAAHLVNLAWKGLAALEAEPGLRTRQEPSPTAAPA